MKTFGLIAHLAKTRIALPLTHIETRFRITGEFAVVEMDQVFEQTARESLDVTYTFPLPAGAVVFRCEMIVNDRLIRAVVMEEQEARRTVAEKKAAGHRTALVEMDRENLFTLQLGNTAPGDRIIIRFAYYDKLDRLGSQLSLRLPFSPGVRYIPGKPLLRKNRGLGWADDTDQVPDASRLSPPRLSTDHEDAATLFLHGTLDDSEVALASIFSPTHPAVLRSRPQQIEVELCGDQHFPNRDFVLRWEETPPEAEARPKAWVCDHTDSGGHIHRYALLQLRAPQPNALPVSDEFAQDIYFLLDRSGSMDGQNWDQAAAALLAFVRQLGTRDRVWLTCFESEFQDFSDSPMLRDEILADAAFLNLAELGTGGGTELLPALRHVLAKRTHYSPQRPARLILITDGQVGNEAEILRLMRQPEQQDLPVHTFGIDEAVNDAFLKSLAQLTGGRCALMTPQDDIPSAVEKLAVTLRRPVLTRLKIEGEGLTPSETTTQPDLCAGEVLLTPIRFSNTITQQIQLAATLPDGSAHTVTYDLTSAEPEEAMPMPRLLWVHHRLRYLIEIDHQQEAIQLAITHNLTCQGTSFVAWDEAEKVPVAKQEVYQPSLETGHPRPAPTMMLASCLPPDSMMSRIASKAPRRLLSLRLNEAQFGDIDASVSLNDTTFNYSTSPISKASQNFPKPLRHLFDTLIQTYKNHSTTDSNNAPRLPHWTTQFSTLLIAKLSLPTTIAFLIAAILRKWAMEKIGTQRDQQLETWLTVLSAAPDFLPALRATLAVAEPSQALKDATALLEAAIAHPVKVKRSWFRRATGL